MVDDLLGLGKAAEKLIDVIQRGIGGALGPWQLKRMERAKTEAEIDRKRQLRAADKKAAEEDVKALPPVPDLATRTDEDEIVIDVEILPPVDERTLGRVSYQEQKRQLNVENVILDAVEQLRGVPDDNVCDEPVDDDWTARFFSNVQDVSNEDMQRLWAKILAGEVKQPGSFSLRTLETLRNLSRKEAELFTKVATLSTLADAIPITKYCKTVLPFEETALLQDAGLLVGDLELKFASLSAEKFESWCIFRDLALRFSQPIPKSAFTFPTYRLTAAGAELARAVVTASNVEHVRSFAETMASLGYHVTMHKVLSTKGRSEAAVLESWGPSPPKLAVDTDMDM